MTAATDLRNAYFAAEDAGDNARQINDILGYLQDNGVGIDPDETEQGLTGQAAELVDRFLDAGWDPAEGRS